MSWLKDPQVFIYVVNGEINFCSVNKQLTVGTKLQIPGDNSKGEDYDFSRHLSLGINKERDYAAFLSYVKAKPESTLINCQGLVAYRAQGYLLSREDSNSPVYSLQGILIASIDAQQRQKQTLERKVSGLETTNSTLRNNEKKLTADVSDLRQQLQREKSDKEAIQKKNSDLESANATSKNNEKKLAAEVSDLQKKLEQEKIDKEALQKKNSDLESMNATLKNNENKLTLEVSELQKKLESEKNDKEALEKQVSDLVSMNATCENNGRKLTAQVSDLQEKLEREKNDKEALDKENFELKSKLEESCGGGGGGSSNEEPWMTDNSVPSSWVPFDNLYTFRKFRKDKHLNISKVMGAPIFREDNTTNVHPSRFYKGIYPIVVVNVSELIPNYEWARFDPAIWSLYQNEGTYYAARKLFESEMVVDAPKRC